MKTDAAIQTAPYLSFKTLLAAVEALEQNTPPKIDRGIWRTQSGVNQGLIMSAFRFFNLVDDNDAPTRSLENLITEKAGRPQYLRVLLESAYAKVFESDPTKMTMKMLEDAFDEYNVSGSTKKKAITFFLQAAKYADVSLSSFLQSQIRNTPATRRRRSNGGKNEKPEGQGLETPPATHGSVGNQRKVELESGGFVTLEISVDPFSLNQKDRAWVFDLIDKLNAYETEKIL